MPQVWSLILNMKTLHIKAFTPWYVIFNNIQWYVVSRSVEVKIQLSFKPTCELCQPLMYSWILSEITFRVRNSLCKTCIVQIVSYEFGYLQKIASLNFYSIFCNPCSIMVLINSLLHMDTGFFSPKYPFFKIKSSLGI